MLRIAAAIVAALITIGAVVYVSSPAYEQRVLSTSTTRGPPSSTQPPVTITVTTPEVTVTVTITLPELPTITLP